MSAPRFMFGSAALLSVGALAAQAHAGVVYTDTLNLAGPAPGASENVLIGAALGETAPQYQYSNTGSHLVLNALGASLIDPLNQTPALPGPHDPFTSTSQTIKFTNGQNDYAHLKFDIGGETYLGTATFTPNADLTTVIYTPVPEPAVWVELIAGLALAGAAARVTRRSRQNAASSIA